MVNDFDTVIRLLAMGASLLLLVMIVSGRTRGPLKIALAGLLIGSASYLLNSSTEFGFSREQRRWLDLLSLLAPFWMWLFARRMFEREPPWWLLYGFIAWFVLCWFTGTFIPATRPFGFYGVHFASLAVVADLIRSALIGRQDDLIERRRLIRLWLPVLVGLQAGGILLFELAVGPNVVSPTTQLISAALILVLNLFAGIALLQTQPELLVDTDNRRPKPTPGPDLTPSELVLRGKLDAAMAAGFYRTPGLTIVSLAEHLATPEHRLRALINRQLGWRNFSSFLNSHRIAEAKVAFANRNKVDLPVLTIAMDLGYNSLPTFNRAFRNETGQTPTDFRRDAICSEIGVQTAESE